MPDGTTPSAGGARDESAAAMFSSPVLTEPVLRRLRLAVIRDPRYHVARLDPLVRTSPMLSEVAVADLHLLRAEAHQQLGDRLAASGAWRSANEAANRLQEPARIAAVAGVRASLAVWMKQRDALELCEGYLTAIAAAAGPGAAPRTVYAQALIAIVVAWQDCTAALSILDDLLPSPAEPFTAVTTMLHNAARAIRERCRTRQEPIRAARVAPPPLPGGLWQPDLTRPDPDRLAWYGRSYPITHTCPPPAGPDSSGQVPG